MHKYFRRKLAKKTININISSKESAHGICPVFLCMGNYTFIFLSSLSSGVQFDWNSVQAIKTKMKTVLCFISLILSMKDTVYLSSFLFLILFIIFFTTYELGLPL